VFLYVFVARYCTDKDSTDQDDDSSSEDSIDQDDDSSDKEEEDTRTNKVLALLQLRRQRLNRFARPHVWYVLH
jgi:hypothetical protein